MGQKNTRRGKMHNFDIILNWCVELPLWLKEETGQNR
jgi:hypothetical protein